MATKTDLFTPMTKGLVAAFGGDMFLKALGLAATFFTLQALSPMQYGFWQLMLSVAAGFSILTFPGIANMLVAEVSREYGAGRKAQGNGIAVRAAMIFISTSAVGAIAMAIFAPFIKQISGINLVALTQILAISVLAYGFKQAYQLAMQSRMLYFHSQALKIVDRLAYFLGIFFFLVVMGRGVDGVVYAYVISTLTSVVLFAPFMFGVYREMFQNRSSEDWGLFVQAVRERGVWVLGSDGVGALTGSMWPWLVGFFLGIETLGLISISVMLIGQVSSFVPIGYVLRSVLPRTVGSPERLREWLYRSMKFSLWAYVVTGLAAFAACVVLFPLWFTQHVAALPIFAALLLSLPMRGISAGATEWFFSTGNQKSYFFVSAVPKLILLVLLPVFLWAGGIFGYVLWNVVTADAILIARLRRIRKDLSTPIYVRQLFSFDRVDADLIARLQALISTKITARFSR